MKNIKIKDYTLKDMLSDILRHGVKTSTYEDGYCAMRDKLNILISEIK